MLMRVAVGCACGVLLGCGGAPPAPAAPPPAAAVATPPTPSVRAPSPKLGRYFAAGDNPRLTLYADLEGLFQTELMEGMLPAALEQMSEFVSGKKQLCIRTLAENARELLVVDGKGGTLALIAFKTGGLTASRNVCLGSLIPANKAEVKGSEEAYATEGGGVIALEPDVIVGGFQPRVEAALAGSHEKEVPAALVLRPGQQLVWRFNSPERGVDGSGSLNVEPERFLLTTELTLPDEATASGIEARIGEGRASIKALFGADNAAGLDELLNALSTKRDGKRLDARFELRGSPEKVAKSLGVVTSLAAFGARKYIQEAKTAEARALVPQIATSYMASFGESPGASPGARAKKKLVSLPAVPAAVPRGGTHKSTAGEWAPWAAIGFSLQEPQAYQYEVLAAKDGKSADVVARGDLDGDGESSTFKIKLTLDPKTQVLSAGPLEEMQPSE